MVTKIWTKRNRQIIVKLLILAVAAVLLTWLLEYRHFINSAAGVRTFISEHPKVFCYNAFVIFFIELALYGIIRKPFLTISVLASIILIIGYIHIAKFQFRGTPLLPEDFQLGSQVGTLSKFVDVISIIKLVIAVIMTNIVGVILDAATNKWLGKEARVPSDIWWKRYRVISRVAIIAVALTGFLLATDFARNHENKREIKLDFLDSKFTDWNQVRNYEETGFLLGFLYNTSKISAEKPAGYSPEMINEIKEELSAKKKDDKDRKLLENTKYNIVLILNESFFDPENVRDVYSYSGGDVTPNLHRLQNEVPSGEMYSVDYGGGTANIEYEILTGLTNYFLKTVPYTNLLPKHKETPSVAQYLKDTYDYKTTAVHPFSGGMYKRDIVLPRMGFDDFVTETELFHNEKDGESDYINDRSAYQEMFDVLSSSEQPQLVSLVTMQNHAPYNKGLYGEPRFVVDNLEDDDEKSSIETYLMTLNLSDQYLGELYDQLQNYKEKTVVLFFGDHSPGVFPRVIESDDKNVSDRARRTPYLIMSNFDLPTKEDLPTTTPNCLTNTLFNLVNIEKPSWYYLLDEVCEEEPILTEAFFDGKAPFMSSELSKYELLSYDLAAGQQYFIRGF